MDRSTLVDIPAHVQTPADAAPSRTRVRTLGSIPLHRAITYMGLVMGDSIGVLVAFYFAWYARYRLEFGGDVAAFNYVEFEAYGPLVASLAILTVIILHFRGMYRLPRTRPLLNEFGGVLMASVLGTMMLYAATTFARYPADSRAAFIYVGLLAAVTITAGRLSTRQIQGLLHRKGLGVEPVLVVGDNNLGRMIMQGLAAQPHLGYHVAGFLGTNGARGFGRFPSLGNLDDIERAIAEHKIEQVFIALPSASHESILSVVDHCRRAGVRFRLVPDLYELRLSQLDLETVYGIPLIGMKESAIRGWNLVVKRVMDVSLSALGLALVGIPMLLVAALIKLDSPGPVLYRQLRVGKNGKPFTMYKFRSMRQGADDELAALRQQNVTGGPTFKLPGDPRRTRVGRVLRRTSLDELPQLWNVLKGEMSLVGPRPPTPDEVASYEEWHKQRLEVSPGMTGLWQVSGRSALKFDEQVMLDVYYIENWSLGLDLSIMVRTLPAVISGGGAY